MKTHIKFKKGQWWIFSSKKASLDCMPKAKFYDVLLAKRYLII